MVTQVEVKELLQALKTAEPMDDARFHEVFSCGVTLLNLSDKDVAREFGASRPTVTRWRNGANAPHPAMRKHVYDLLERHAKRILKRLGSEAENTQRGGFGSYDPVPLAARGRAVS